MSRASELGRRVRAIALYQPVQTDRDPGFLLEPPDSCPSDVTSKCRDRFP